MVFVFPPVTSWNISTKNEYLYFIYFSNNDMTQAGEINRNGEMKLFILYIFNDMPDDDIEITVGLGSAEERRRYKVTSSLIGLAHIQNDLSDMMRQAFWYQVIHTSRPGMIFF